LRCEWKKYLIRKKKKEEARIAAEEAEKLRQNRLRIEAEKRALLEAKKTRRREANEMLRHIVEIARHQDRVRL
jgi:hypothetical protein